MTPPAGFPVVAIHRPQAGGCGKPAFWLTHRWEPGETFVAKDVQFADGSSPVQGDFIDILCGSCGKSIWTIDTDHLELRDAT